ncbi:Meiotic sister-chromatid recombination- protein 3, partial [Fusarium falciforme]
MFDKVLQFSQETTATSTRRNKANKLQLLCNAEESFPAAPISEGVTTAKPSSNE